MNCLSPSILSADMGDLASDIRCVDEAGAQYIHIDVMDGAFVPQISFGIPVLRAVREVTDRILDVHLMINEPQKHVEMFAKAGADIITVHQEACIHLDRVVNQIKDCGVLAGVAINPATPVSTLENILPELDMVLIMSVNPGYGGQTFIPYTLDKIKTIRNIIEERGLSTDLEVDGGVSLENATEILNSGANVLVAGSAVFNTNVAENVRSFLSLMQKGA